MLSVLCMHLSEFLLHSLYCNHWLGVLTVLKLVAFHTKQTVLFFPFQLWENNYVIHEVLLWLYIKCSRSFCFIEHNCFTQEIIHKRPTCSPFMVFGCKIVIPMVFHWLYHTTKIDFHQVKFSFLLFLHCFNNFDWRQTNNSQLVANFYANQRVKSVCFWLYA